MKDSSNTCKLVAALAEQFYEKVKNNKPQKVNRSAADSSSEGDGTVVASGLRFRGGLRFRVGFTSYSNIRKICQAPNV